MSASMHLPPRAAALTARRAAPPAVACPRDNVPLAALMVLSSLPTLLAVPSPFLLLQGKGAAGRADERGQGLPRSP